MLNQLSDRQKLFIKLYLTDLNVSKAAKQSGYLPSYGRMLLKNKLISDEIEKLKSDKLQQIDIDCNYVLKNLKDVVETSLVKIKVDDVDHFVDSSSGLKSLELLGKYKKMWTDKSENINVTTDFDEYIKKISDDSEW